MRIGASESRTKVIYIKGNITSKRAYISSFLSGAINLQSAIFFTHPPTSDFSRIDQRHLPTIRACSKQQGR